MMPSSSHHDDEALKKDSDTRVHLPVIPRKHADAMNVESTTPTEGARRVKLTDSEHDLISKGVRFSRLSPLTNLCLQQIKYLSISLANLKTDVWSCSRTSVSRFQSSVKYGFYNFFAIKTSSVICELSFS